MAVTDFIDDEKPLYVGTDDALRITGFHDQNESKETVIYLVAFTVCALSHWTPFSVVWKVDKAACVHQRALVADGLKLEACPFVKFST